ncbi:MAG: hypothetical protein HS115_10855 [Spirochaetales bacterium]|nr:hypothetical protein [Spirochaetales bacterium]
MVKVSALLIFVALGCAAPPEILVRHASSSTGLASVWEVFLEEASIGPNRYGGTERRDSFKKKASAGTVYVHVLLRIHNNGETVQPFPLMRIQLEGEGVVRYPWIMDQASWRDKKSVPSPEVKPGQSLRRRVIYSWPEKSRPERLVLPDIFVFSLSG